jgi:hypothetical protein
MDAASDACELGRLQRPLLFLLPQGVLPVAVEHPPPECADADAEPHTLAVAQGQARLSTCGQRGYDGGAPSVRSSGREGALRRREGREVPPPSPLSSSPFFPTSSFQGFGGIMHYLPAAAWTILLRVLFAYSVSQLVAQ